jgi:hypothetical protein
MLFLRSAIFLAAASAIPISAASLATVTSASPFALDGRSINTPGVTSFPLVLGDLIATSSGPAVVLFQDGSKVKLLPNSSVKIAGVAAKPKLVLLSGSLDYKLIPGSILSVTNLDIERKQQQRTQPAAAPARPTASQSQPLSPERAMLAALDGPATVSADSAAATASPEPSTPVAPLSSGKASPAPRTGSVLNNPKFLVPVGGAGAAGLATALVRLPPVSRRL